MENIEHIDVHNLEKQRRDAIIETGNYARAEIVVGKDNLPSCTFHVSGVTSDQVAILLSTMLKLQKEIIKIDPAAGIMSLRVEGKVKGYFTEQELKDKENGNKEG